MNETVTKRFLLYFRLMLLVWILIANAIIHLTGMEYSWLIFLSNIMMFTLEGDVKDRLVTVELGDFLQDCPGARPLDVVLANELDDGCVRSGGRNTDAPATLKPRGSSPQ